MDAINFSRELDNAIKGFKEDAGRYGQITDGVDICLCNGYFILRAEVEDDETEDIIVCKQEFEYEDSDLAPINALYFTTEQ